MLCSQPLRISCLNCVFSLLQLSVSPRVSMEGLACLTTPVLVLMDLWGLGVKQVCMNSLRLSSSHVSISRKLQEKKKKKKENHQKAFFLFFPPIFSLKMFLEYKGFKEYSSYFRAYIYQEHCCIM